MPVHANDNDRYGSLNNVVLDLELGLIQRVELCDDIIGFVRPAEGILFEPGPYCFLRHLLQVVHHQISRQILHSIWEIVGPPTARKAVHFATERIFPRSRKDSETRCLEDDFILAESFIGKCRSLVHGNEEQGAVIEPIVFEDKEFFGCVLGALDQEFIVVGS